MKLVRNAVSGVIHFEGCQGAGPLAVPWQLLDGMDGKAVAEFTERTGHHLHRCALPFRCRCDKCSPVTETG